MLGIGISHGNAHLHMFHSAGSVQVVSSVSQSEERVRSCKENRIVDLWVTPRKELEIEYQDANHVNWHNSELVFVLKCAAEIWQTHKVAKHVCQRCREQMPSPDKKKCCIHPEQRRVSQLHKRD